MVSPDGFNALLKLIEEPPAHVKFVFATTEVDKVLPTIRSRTHNYTFRLVPARAAAAAPAGICEAEGVAAGAGGAGPGRARRRRQRAGRAVGARASSSPARAPRASRTPTAVAQLGVTDAALLDDGRRGAGRRRRCRAVRRGRPGGRGRPRPAPLRHRPAGAAARPVVLRGGPGRGGVRAARRARRAAGDDGARRPRGSGSRSCPALPTWSTTGCRSCEGPRRPGCSWSCSAPGCCCPPPTTMTPRLGRPAGPAGAPGRGPGRHGTGRLPRPPAPRRRAPVVAGRSAPSEPVPAVPTPRDGAAPWRPARRVAASGGRPRHPTRSIGRTPPGAAGSTGRAGHRPPPPRLSAVAPSTDPTRP